MKYRMTMYFLFVYAPNLFVNILALFIYIAGICLFI